MESIYANQTLQWAYCRRPMYCRMDTSVLDFAGWNFWDILDGCLDAPECYPVGSLFGQGKYYRSFVCRGYDIIDHTKNIEFENLLIDEIKEELHHEQ